MTDRKTLLLSIFVAIALCACGCGKSDKQHEADLKAQWHATQPPPGYIDSAIQKQRALAEQSNKSGK